MYYLDGEKLEKLSLFILIEQKINYFTLIK